MAIPPDTQWGNQCSRVCLLLKDDTNSTSTSMILWTYVNSFIFSNIFTDEVPRRLIIGLLDHEAYIGHKNKSPFNFKPYDVRDIKIVANGREYTATPFNLKYGKKLYALAYHHTLDNLGFAFTAESNGITYSMYKKGWNLYVFNLTNRYCHL